MKQIAALFTSAFALILLTTGCKRNENEIVIGEFASLTGATATFGQSSHKGTQLAIDEVNAAGGVLGKRLRLVTEDDQSKQGEAAVVVRKLISRDKAVAILGEVASGRSKEAAPVCQNSKIPMISPASTNPEVTAVGDYIFRICFIDPFQGTVLAKFAQNKGWRKAAILTDVKQDYSVGLTRFFKETFAKNDGAIVAEQNYSTDDTDFNAQLTQMKAAAPDCILVSGYYTEAGLIAKQARQLGINVPLLGGDGWDSPSLVQVAGTAMEGNFFSNHYSAEDQSEVVQGFLKKFKNPEEADAMAALGYDSAMILVDAMKRVPDGAALVAAMMDKKDPAKANQARAAFSAKLRDAIATTKDFPGVTGKITLDENRNASKPAVILTIKDGKFKYVETVTP